LCGAENVVRHLVRSVGAERLPQFLRAQQAADMVGSEGGASVGWDGHVDSSVTWLAFHFYKAIEYTAMPRSAARALDTPKRRAAEIRAAAAKVFAERGYHNATTQDIADVLGIRQASLYYYIPTKEAALEEVCLDGAEGYVSRAAAIQRGQGDAMQKLGALVREHLEPLRDRTDFVRVFLRERRHLPDASRRRIGRHARRYERIVQQVLQEGVTRREFRRGLDCRMAALAAIGMCNAAAAWYGREPEASLERISSAFTQLLIEGVVYPQQPAATPRKRRAGR
jgi:AcrR family transcriptional regulator